MPDLEKIVKDRRAGLLAEQAKIVAELARLDEFARMMAILSEYDRDAGDSEQTTRTVFNVRFLGLARGGEPRRAIAGGSDRVQMNGPGNAPVGPQNPGPARTSAPPAPARTAPGAQPAPLPPVDQDHFEFND